MGFQQSVNSYVAPGLPGGWASYNPGASLLQPNTGDLTLPNAQSWKVGTTGAIVGNFAFADTTTGLVTAASPGTGTVETDAATGRLRVGFVQRDQTSLITEWLDNATLTVPAGVGITLITAGDVWTAFSAGATIGQFVFARYADGSAVAGDTTTAPTTTFSVTTTSGSANLTAVGAGAVAGMPVSGTGIPAGAYLVSVSGSTAVLSANATASGTVTATGTVAALTRYRVRSAASATELAKISVQG